MNFHSYTVFQRLALDGVRLALFVILSLTATTTAAELQVGAAAVELQGEDSMIIGASILPRYVKGQEGALRAVAVVVRDASGQRVAIVACDVIMMNRDLLDTAADQILKRTGISTSNVLINCTHTHSAPTTCTVHGYVRDEAFSRQVQRAIVDAVVQADERCQKSRPTQMYFRLGQETTVGQNSRLRLPDGTIRWTGKTELTAPATGPFDPDLPVIGFRRDDGTLAALLFGHSTHTIGSLAPNVRSPAFYGMAAQAIERQLGVVTLFLEGASGSTHNLVLKPVEAEQVIRAAVLETWKTAAPLPVNRVGAIKREVTVTVRRFDEAKEEAAVSSYCRKHIPGARAEETIQVFRDMRRKLAGHQGEQRKTWVQAMCIGDVAIVGVPAEYFTVLGVDIKRRSPFKHTIIAELANDWIGYVGDRPAYELGGYQVWMGLHSWTERGTGEYIADEAVKILHALQGRKVVHTSSAR